MTLVVHEGQSGTTSNYWLVGILFALIPFCLVATVTVYNYRRRKGGNLPHLDVEAELVPAHMPWWNDIGEQTDAPPVVSDDQAQDEDSFLWNLPVAPIQSPPVSEIDIDAFLATSRFPPTLTDVSTDSAEAEADEFTEAIAALVRVEETPEAQPSTNDRLQVLRPRSLVFVEPIYDRARRFTPNIYDTASPTAAPSTLSAPWTYDVASSTPPTAYDVAGAGGLRAYDMANGDPLFDSQPSETVVDDEVHEIDDYRDYDIASPNDATDREARLRLQNTDAASTKFAAAMRAQKTPPPSNERVYDMASPKEDVVETSAFPWGASSAPPPQHRFYDAASPGGPNLSHTSFGTPEGSMGRLPTDSPCNSWNAEAQSYDAVVNPKSTPFGLTEAPLSPWGGSRTGPPVDPVYDEVQRWTADDDPVAMANMLNAMAADVYDEDLSDFEDDQDELERGPVAARRAMRQVRAKSAPSRARPAPSDRGRAAPPTRSRVASLGRSGPAALAREGSPFVDSPRIARDVLFKAFEALSRDGSNLSLTSQELGMSFRPQTVLMVLPDFLSWFDLNRTGAVTPGAVLESISRLKDGTISAMGFLRAAQELAKSAAAQPTNYGDDLVDNFIASDNTVGGYATVADMNAIVMASRMAGGYATIHEIPEGKSSAAAAAAADAEWSAFADGEGVNTWDDDETLSI